MDHFGGKHTYMYMNIKRPVKIWISLRIHGGWSESSPDWYFMQTGKTGFIVQFFKLRHFMSDDSKFKKQIKD